MQTDSATRARLVEYVPLDALATRLEMNAGRVLGIATYGSHGVAAAPDARVGAVGTPRATVGLAALAPARPYAELWLTDAVRDRAIIGPVQCAWSDELLFGAMNWKVEESVPQPGGATPLQQASLGVYEAAFEAMRKAGFKHLMRAWNYFPAINREAGEPGGLERYRQFNIGRAEAMVAAGARMEEGASAACALGAPGGDLVLYFLATRSVPRAIENPRQVSAYRYPAQYGPRSPNFSRAALAHINDEPRLLISGTASIVGHATLHAGDVAAQTRETLANLHAVVAEANRALDPTGCSTDRAPHFALAELALKAYVRRPADLPIMQREVTAALGAAVDVIYLQADICRSDLLVEIEACG